MIALATLALAVIPFDSGWQFAKGGGDWMPVTLPHDWATAGTFKQSAPEGGAGARLRTGRGTYTKSFTLPAADLVEGVRGAKLELASYVAGDLPPFDPAYPDPPEAGTLPTGEGWVAGQGVSVCEKPPCYFQAKVPREGNYRVTVKLGDLNAASVTTIKAELRRLMVEKVETKKGEFATRTFLVNTRTPGFEGGEVRLKDREKTTEAAAWDDALDLEFTNTRPAVASIEIEPAQVPTLYIAGDSTSTDQPREPFNSWGQMITAFFKPEIAIANHGESGESLRSFVAEKRLAKLMNVIRPGDWLFIQMGHNDQKERGEGVGAFTTYKASLKDFIKQARDRGATPVLVTSMNRLTFDAQGQITNSLGDYPEAVRQTGKEENVAVIDLNAMSKPLYEALGPKEAHNAFAGSDTTHHSNYGSYELAKCVIEAIRELKLPLAKYIFDGLPRFDPAHPDPLASFAIPAEPSGAVQRPYGQ